MAQSQTIENVRSRLQDGRLSIKIPRGMSSLLVQDATLRHPNAAVNKFGLFSPMEFDQMGEFIIMRSVRGKYKLRINKPCSWNPVTGFNIGSEKVLASSMAFETEFCPAGSVAKDLAYLLDTGNDKNDLNSKEGQAFLNFVLDEIKATLEDDPYDLFFYMGDEAIAAMTEPTSFDDDQKAVFNAYKAMTTESGHRGKGFIPLSRALAADGHKHHALETKIDVSGFTFNDDGVYQGDIFALIRQCLNNSTAELQNIRRSNPQDVCILMSPGFFNKFDEAIHEDSITTHSVDAGYLHTIGPGDPSGLFAFLKMAVVHEQVFSNYAQATGDNKEYIMISLKGNLNVGGDIVMGPQNAAIKVFADEELSKKGQIQVSAYPIIGAAYGDLRFTSLLTVNR